MKGSLIVVALFLVGCLVGHLLGQPFEAHQVSMYILYALMFQVGISIGSNKELKVLWQHLRLKLLFIPLATIVGTLLFSALASLILKQWSVFDCLAVGSGFAYYSLSSILITQFKEASIGLQLATELKIFRTVGSHIRRRSQLNGCCLAYHHQIYGKGDDPDRDPAWNLDGYKRPVLRLVLLPVLIRLAYPAADYIQIPNEIAIGINRC